MGDLVSVRKAPRLRLRLARRRWAHVGRAWVGLAWGSLVVLAGLSSYVTLFLILGGW